MAAANATQSAVLVAGVAGLVAGAISMVAGEYVSVSSQSDTDIARERQELATDGAKETNDILGCDGDGDHGGRRQAVRGGHLNDLSDEA